MKRSPTLANPGPYIIKATILATTLVALCTCFITEAAQAQIVRRRLFRYSGTSNEPGIDTRNFEVDTSVQDSAPDDTVGIFRDAVQNFQIQLVGLSTQLDEDFIESSNEEFTLLKPFSSGDIFASVISESDLAEFGLSFANLIQDPDDPKANQFSNGGVKYEAIFDNAPLKLTFFIPLTEQSTSLQLSLINSLSTLQDYLQDNQFSSVQAIIQSSPPVTDEPFIQGYGLTCRTELGNVIPSEIPQNADLCEDFQLGSGAEPLSLEFSDVETEVPEPATAISLLGLGAIGATSLSKNYYRRLKKTTGSYRSN
jgi:hypothetical protein